MLLTTRSPSYGKGKLRPRWRRIFHYRRGRFQRKGAKRGLQSRPAPRLPDLCGREPQTRRARRHDPSARPSAPRSCRRTAPTALARCFADIDTQITVSIWATRIRRLRLGPFRSYVSTRGELAAAVRKGPSANPAGSFEPDRCLDFAADLLRRTD